MQQSKTWQKDITKFLAAQTISLLGSSLVQYAIIWYITLQTSSGSMMAVATLCGYLPQIILSLFAGVWIDRYNRRFLSIVSDAAIALSTLIVAILFLMGHQQIWLLFTVLIVRSLGTGIQTPTVNAIIPQIVPAEKLLKVNSINSTLSAVIMFMSPVLSGIILSLTSIEITFFVDVITAIIGIGIMFTINIPDYERIRKSDEAGADIFKEMKQGLQYLRENKALLQLTIFVAFTMILVSPSAFLTPLLVARSFGPEVWRLSVSEMFFGLGAAVGGIFMSWRCENRHYLQTIIRATAVYALMMIMLGLAPTFVLYLLFNFLIGLTMPCFNAPYLSLVQEQVISGMHGRIFSILQIVNACALPIGTIIFGPLADVVSIGFIMAACGLLMLVWTWYNIKLLSID